MSTTESIEILLQEINCGSKKHPIPFEIISADTGFSRLKTMLLIIIALLKSNPIKITNKGFYYERVEE